MCAKKFFNISSYLIIILIFGGCSGFTLFDGNTKRDYRDYGLEQRATYRKTQSLKKIIQKESEAEILKRLKEDEKRNTQK